MRLEYDLIAAMLSGMEKRIREDAELPEDIQSDALGAIETAKARVLINAVFDLE